MISTIGPSIERRGLRFSGIERSAGGASRRKGEAGFTLLELILVMVVICMVLGMAAPYLRGFFESRGTADAAAQIVALAQYARTQAAAEGRVYHLNLDMESGRYWLTAQTAGAFTPLASEFGRVFSFPEGTAARWQTVSDATAAGWIPFYPDGRTAPADIVLVGRHGDTQEIVCLSPAERLHVVNPPEGGAR